jgi:sugar O-acyltransferase (sialic acid O-acetyltransferase NeuD family)
MADLVVVGAGGHAREIVAAILAASLEPAWRIVGVVADGETHPERIAALGLPLLGGVERLPAIGLPYTIGIGSPEARRRVDALASEAGLEAVTVVHPSAVVGPEVHLDPGCYVAAGAVLTTNVRLGRHSHLNVSASVAHDCILGPYCTIAPGARLGGHVTLDEGVDIGLGAVVLPGVVVGRDAVVGAGAAVIRDVAAGSTVAGVPARKLSLRSPVRP